MPKRKLPEVFYHASHEEYLPSIEKEGLKAGSWLTWLTPGETAESLKAYYGKNTPVFEIILNKDEWDPAEYYAKDSPGIQVLESIPWTRLKLIGDN